MLVSAMIRNPRIDEQLEFLIEADKLKSVLRATSLCDKSRNENSGEHSWHVALYALVLAEHAVKPVDVSRVIKMLLIHDLVEIDAGDAPIHGKFDADAQARAEQNAANRIFGLLPPDQARDFRALWDEFETAETDDAVFAKSIDRVQPLVSNLESGGTSWTEYDVTFEQVENRVGTKVHRGAPDLWWHVRARIVNWFSAT